MKVKEYIEKFMAGIFSAVLVMFMACGSVYAQNTGEAYSRLAGSQDRLPKAEDEFPLFLTAVSEGEPGMPVLITFRSTQPTQIKVDFGDGQQRTVTVDSAITPVQDSMGETGTIKVYGDAGKIWVVGMTDARLISVELASMPALWCLNLHSNRLSTVELANAPALGELTLAENPLKSLDLKDVPHLYYLNLTGSKLSEVDLTGLEELKILYMDGMGLKKVDVTSCPSLYVFRCAFNELTDLDFSMNPKLSEIHCNDNRLKKLDISNNPELRYLDCRNNNLILGTLPVFHPIVSTSFKYAPQNEYPMPYDTMGYVDFSAGHEIEGFTSEYVWRTESGRTLVKGIDYESSGGKHHFLVDGLKVMCQLENGFFPDFVGENALRTDFFVTKRSDVGNEGKVQDDCRIYVRKKMICAEFDGLAEVEVFDVRGVLCARKKGNASIRIPMSVPGLYVVRLSSPVSDRGGQVRRIQKVVVNE